MNTIMRLIAVILMLIVPSWTLADNYLCLEDQVVGFSWEDRKWQTGTFMGEKYIVKLQGAETVITEFGKEFSTYSDCSNNLFFTPKNRIVCRSGYGEFYFNTVTKRFMRSYMAGYAEGDEDGNTPLISIQTCSKF